MAVEETPTETVVVFRKWRDTGDVIALFPEDDEGRGMISSFQHVGQHGGADYDGVIKQTVPATEEEYAALKRELESPPYEYRLTVATDDALWLKELFEFGYCDECHLDADAHTVGLDPLGNRHAWCKVGDPAFALQVLRDNVQQGDTSNAANGYADADLRFARFQAAALELDEEDMADREALMRWRGWVNRPGPIPPLDIGEGVTPMQMLNNLFARIEEKIERSKTNAGE